MRSRYRRSDDTLREKIINLKFFSAIIVFLLSWFLLVIGSSFFINIFSQKSLTIKACLIGGAILGILSTIYLTEKHVTFKVYIFKGLLVFSIVFLSFVLMVLTQINLTRLYCQMVSCDNSGSFGMVLVYFFVIPLTLVNYIVSRKKLENPILSKAIPILTGSIIMIVFIILTS